MMWVMFEHGLERSRYPLISALDFFRDHPHLPGTPAPWPPALAFMILSYYKPQHTSLWLEEA